MRADEVLPVPRGPAKIRACGRRTFFKAFKRVRLIWSCPINLAKSGGRHLRAKLLCADVEVLITTCPTKRPKPYATFKPLRPLLLSRPDGLRTNLNCIRPDHKQPIQTVTTRSSYYFVFLFLFTNFKIDLKVVDQVVHDNLPLVIHYSLPLII